MNELLLNCDRFLCPKSFQYVYKNCNNLNLADDFVSLKANNNTFDIFDALIREDKFILFFQLLS